MKGVGGISKGELSGPFGPHNGYHEKVKNKVTTPMPEEWPVTALGAGHGQSLWRPGVKVLPRGLARMNCLVYPEPVYQITQAPSPSTGIVRLVQKGPAELCPIVPQGSNLHPRASVPGTNLTTTPRTSAGGRGPGSPPSLLGPSSPEGSQHQRQEMKKNLRSN